MAEPDQGQLSPATALGLEPRTEGESIPWKEVLGFARRIAQRYCDPKQAHLADDIAQESAIKLFENYSNIRIGWRPYLSQIVANTARTILKREGSLNKLTCVNSGQVEFATDDEPDVQSQVSTLELESRLRGLLDELDIKFGLGTRTILEFRTQKVPWEEIATIVPLSVKTCWNRHQKATRWLCKRLSLPFPKGEQHD